MDAVSLARRLAALPAAAMRQATLRATLDALDDDAAARLCAELVRRGPDGAPFDVALLALTAVLDDGGLGYERHAALYAGARAPSTTRSWRACCSRRSRRRPARHNRRRRSAGAS